VKEPLVISQLENVRHLEVPDELRRPHGQGIIHADAES
jgi:hypothetical protein